MAWVTLQIGVLGQEKTLSFKVQTLAVTHNDVEVKSQNIEGDVRKTKLKVNKPYVQMTGAELAIADYNLLYSMKSRQTILNWLMRSDLAIIDEQDTSSDTTHITLTNSCATGITITGVYLTTDPNHAGTNYFTGGSFNSTTKVITLGSALPNANTSVLVQYGYTGQSVTIEQLVMTAMQGQSQNYFTANIQLQGA